MKILVFSDSHGDVESMRRALASHPDADRVVHLGDGATEALRLRNEDTKRSWTIVRGNCDIDRSLPENAVETWGGKRFYITHGAAERVKTSLITLFYTARETDADVALYGHTHCAATDFNSSMLLFNPGSIGAGSYGVITVEGGVVRSTLYRV